MLSSLPDIAPLAEEYLPLAQYKGQYILVSGNEGLMLVHQRRAHTRILFEKYREQLFSKRGHSQGLLFPERADLSLNESVALEGITEELSSLGFDISSLGGNSYAINAVPAGIDGLDPVALLVDIVRDVVEQTAMVKERLYDRIALSVAGRMAIAVGQVLSQEEIQTLVKELFDTSMPQRTPDGLPVVHLLHDTEIVKFFSK